jgi:hypothetical protein
MNRYNFGTRDIYRHDTGDWVMYDDVAELTRKLEALRNEVKAWREADEREDMLFNTLGEEDRNRILQAITNTDNTGALEDER